MSVAPYWWKTLVNTSEDLTVTWPKVLEAIPAIARVENLTETHEEEEPRKARVEMPVFTSPEQAASGLENADWVPILVEMMPGAPCLVIGTQCETALPLDAVDEVFHTMNRLNSEYPELTFSCKKGAVCVEFLTRSYVFYPEGYTLEQLQRVLTRALVDTCRGAALLESVFPNHQKTPSGPLEWRVKY